MQKRAKQFANAAKQNKKEKEDAENEKLMKDLEAVAVVAVDKEKIRPCPLLRLMLLKSHLIYCVLQDATKKGWHG